MLSWHILKLGEALAVCARSADGRMQWHAIDQAGRLVLHQQQWRKLLLQPQHCWCTLHLHMHAAYSQWWVVVYGQLIVRANMPTWEVVLDACPAGSICSVTSRLDSALVSVCLGSTWAMATKGWGPSRVDIERTSRGPHASNSASRSTIPA